jgi:predicted esterase
MLREKRLTVERSARVVYLGAATPAVREVWMACHGYGQLAARFLARFDAIAGDDRLVVAPEALNRFYLDGRVGPHGPESKVGATWMTREDRLHEIDDYVNYLDRVHDTVFRDVDRRGVKFVALGFSQGVATVCRWAARTRARVDELVLWAGRLPPELEPGASLFGDARITVVTGDHDAGAGAEKRAAYTAALRAGGMAVDELGFDGGHHIDGAALHSLAARIGHRHA